MYLKKNFICIASILSPHGIKGHFKVKSFTSIPKDFVSYGDVYNEQKIKMDISIVSNSNNYLICKSEGVNNRSDAQKLNFEKLYILRIKLPKLDKNEYYNFDLIGLKVYKKDREYVGYVKNILNYGAGEILEVKVNKKKTILLPFSQKNASSISLKSKEIEIDISEDWFNEE